MHNKYLQLAWKELSTRLKNRHSKLLKTFLIATLSTLAAGCCNLPEQLPVNSPPLPPVRFLLSFDDGPSTDTGNNPTAKIAATLASNNIQPGIKAVFFVQTRWPEAGGSALGRQLMQRLAVEKHVLGLHSGSVRGHISHIEMDPIELDATLRTGIADIESVSGEATDLVRPTFWEFNATTLAIYKRAGLKMLMTDASARDGSLALFQVERDGGRLNCDLVCFRLRLSKGRVAVVDGVAPVVVTFHDTNHYTAEHLPEYLSALVRSARNAGLEVAEPPFYSDHTALRQAAHARTGSTYVWHNSIVKTCKE